MDSRLRGNDVFCGTTARAIDVTIKCFFASCAIALLPAASALADSKSAIAEIAKQFDHHPVIMIGELHRSAEIHAFVREMLRDPEFICRVDDLVVEFGNARLQSVMDTYIAGGEVSEAQLQSTWRETLPPFAWNSPVYRQFLDTARAINQQHLCKHPIRVLLADPPIDWSKITSAKEYAPFTDRGGHYAQLIEREVLAKHHHALFIAGLLHAMRQVPKDMEDGPTVVQLVEAKHPGALFVIASVPLPVAAQALNMGEPPSFRVVRGSELEHANGQLSDFEDSVKQATADGKQVVKFEPDKGWPQMGAMYDGLLYFGGDHKVFPSPKIYLDPVYQKELRRRAVIIKSYSGQDFMPMLDDLVKQAQKGE
jgi:hypothetical protein